MSIDEQIDELEMEIARMSWAEFPTMRERAALNRKMDEVAELRRTKEEEAMKAMKSDLELAIDDMPTPAPTPKKFGAYEMETRIPKTKTLFADMARGMAVGVNSFFFTDAKEADRLCREIAKQFGAGSFLTMSYDGSEEGQPAGTRVWREDRTPRKRKAKPDTVSGAAI